MTHRNEARHPLASNHPPHRLARRLGAGAAITALAIGGAAIPALPAAADDSDLFGPNVTIFDDTWTADEISAALQAASQEAEFSLNRHQFFFKPGTYGSAAGQNNPATATDIVNSELGYYQAVAGLGASPEDVRINGSIHVEPVRACEATPWDCQAPGSLTRFWRSMSNLTFNPIQRPVGVDADRPNNQSGVTNAHQMRFAVSQAAPLRRINIEGSLTLMGRYGEQASGGYLANSKVSGEILSGSQQQWFTRNTSVGTWNGGVWNMVFSGVTNAPATDFGPQTGSTLHNKTNIGATPIVRESPFLYFEDDAYKVFVPKAKTESTGYDWSTDASAGESIPLSEFFVVKEGATAAQINAALADGKNLLITPGVYNLDAALEVDHADTVILGLGYASLVPTNGNAAIEVGDVKGVKIAGLTVDAGTTLSDVLLKIGPDGATQADPADPTTLTDVFIRIGGPWAGKATTSIEVNSPNTLLDHIWAWRADHGQGVGWTSNVGDHGVVVNGDNVTALGLFVEHYQKNQVIWNGERGRTVFYQSEIPYDPPTQGAYMDGARNGYASYKVGDNVRQHFAQGLGVYSFFDPQYNGAQNIYVESGIQVPQRPGVKIQSAVSVFLNGTGGITHIVNDQGDTAQGPGGGVSKFLVSYETAVDPNAQNLQVTVPVGAPGEFVWAIDGSNDIVSLGTATEQGDHFAAEGSINPVRVTDTRRNGPTWSVSAQVSDFDSNVASFSGKYLGWTPEVTEAGGGTVAGAPVQSGFVAGDGLSVSSTLGHAAQGHERGSAKLGADLDLRIPIDSTDGTYRATLTITALS
ncbi:adenylyl cyclase [Agromyces protaetiae]|uniref:adenylyl cyclase n=1 Tax=Agromyces protaetiae TaxID=2509455 RepID=UPI001AA06E9F|nr:adenylyl cyclase [Agromyces protaetiae]